MASIAAKRTAAIRSGIRSRSKCPDFECGGNDYIGCEPWKHLELPLERFWSDAVLHIEPQDGEFAGMGVSLYSDGSVGVYDNVNDETAYVIRNKRQYPVLLNLLAADWHMEYLPAEKQEWVKKLAGV